MMIAIIQIIILIIIVVLVLNRNNNNNDTCISKKKTESRPTYYIVYRDGLVGGVAVVCYFQIWDIRGVRRE